MSELQIIKLSDFVRDIGEDEAKKRLSSFSCGGLNEEVEQYLCDGAFRHSKKKTSITYLVMASGDTRNCLAYYTLAVKPFSVKFSRLTARQKDEMKDLARINISREEKNYGISSYLIAQLAKNYAIAGGKKVSGRDLIGFILDQIRGIWSAFRDWFTETDFYDLFLAANDFREDHPQFAAALSAAQSRFHLTPSETAAILAESAAR